MPMLQIYTSKKLPVSELNEIQKRLATALTIPNESVWVTQLSVEDADILTGNTQRPIVFFNCRTNYSETQVDHAVSEVRNSIAQAMAIPSSEVFCAVNRIPDQNIYSPLKPTGSIQLVPIGHVSNSRTEAEDDNWNSIESQIILSPEHLSFDATEGLKDFSHIEVVFYMHKVKQEKITTGARHPRNNQSWPKVGILSQRGKNRVNQIGVSRCQLLEVNGLSLKVQGLDAINETPILDIKPLMMGFLPQGSIREPAWAKELMSNYY